MGTVAPVGCAVSLRNIRKTFGKFTALHGVSLDIAPGEFVTLLGPSGCGKTTLLRILAGLEIADAGEVHIGDRDVTREPAARRGCGIVFQSYALFPNLTATENVAFGMRALPKAQRIAKARELLALVQLTPEADKHPGQLSGGQQQRVALARALAIEPRVLLLDEPLSALDAKVRVSLRMEIRALQRRLGLTTIMVTHDQEEALTMADRVVVMRQGAIAQQAAPEDLYRYPADAFVADFVGHMNLLHGWTSDGNGLVTRGALRLNAPTGKAPGPVSLAIRPEHVIPVLDASSLPGETVNAVVESLEFRGAVHHALLRMGGPEGEPLQMEVRGGFGADRVRAGDVIRVRLPSEALHLFPVET